MARGHGPAPSVLEPLSLDAGGVPDVLRLNTGLAIRDELGWWYGCPSQWAGSEQAFAAADPDGAAIVVLGQGRVFASWDGGCSYGEVAVSGRAEQVAWAEDRAWVVTRSEAGGALWVVTVEGADQVASWEGAPPHDVVPYAGRQAAVAVSSAEAVRLFDADGLVSTSSAPRSQHLALAAASESGMWAVASMATGRVLLRGEDDRLVEAGGPYERIHGPVPWEGSWLAVADGRLITWDGRAWLDGAPVSWTCLTELVGVVFACEISSLYRVTDSRGEPATELVFDISELSGPRAGCPPHEAAADACLLDWYHFGGESGLIEPAAPPASDDAPDGDGCHGGGGVGISGLVWLLAGVAFRRQS